MAVSSDSQTLISIPPSVTGGLVTFSAKTCLELLPQLSTDQLEYEFKHFVADDPNCESRTRNPGDVTKRDLIYRSLTRTLISDIDNIVKNYDSLISNISYSVHEAQKHVDEMRVRAENVSFTPPPSSDPATQVKDSESELLSEEPVCLLNNISFSELTVEQICSTIDFKDTLAGGRQIAYFGDQPYTYGKITHDPASYPDLPFLDILFDKLNKIDSDFNRANYSCLITYYKDGSVIIPQHQDNEYIIADDSLIYTVSIGQERTLNVFNTIGPIEKIRRYSLPHGSVHTMSRDSQFIWSHGIDKEPHCKDPRVSFTFRKLNHPDTTAPTRKSEIPPPITLTPRSPPDHDKPKRILFLTDSNLVGCPPHIFNEIENHICVKKPNFKLVDIFKYEKEFSYSDYVVLNCGVNDLSRYDYTASSLADRVYKYIDHCCTKYPNTKFIFCSILSTRFESLNNEISEFNRMIFDLSLRVANLWFFDSHYVLCTSNLKDILDPAGNGIHITIAAKKLISRELVNCIGHVGGSRSARFRLWRWPLRDYFYDLQAACARGRDLTWRQS